MSALERDRSPRRPAVGGSGLVRMLLVPALIVVGTLGLQAATHGQAIHAGTGWPALLAVIAVLLLCSGFVACAETALFSLDKLDLSKLRSDDGPLERFVARLLDRPNDTLATLLILNNTFNIAISLTTGVLMDRLLGGGTALAFAVAAGAATTAILLFGEILPKLIATLDPPRLARVLGPPLALAHALIWPLRALLNAPLGLIFRRLRIPTHSGEEDVSEHELKAMMSSGEVSSVLEDDEREMIDGVFELRRATAEAILTPRLQVSAVPDDLDQESMVERLRHMPNNRVLVYHESLDHLVGFVLVKEVLLDRHGDWHDHIREALCVPEGVGLLDLLRTFRRERTKMAVVVDEFGSVTGIVTLQDLLEEIVGDMYEQHEHPQVEIERLAADRWRVNGAMHLSDLAEELHVEFPEHKGRTVGGFVMNTLGRIPSVGDEVAHESLILRVAEMAARRVNVVEVAVNGEAEARSGRGAREGEA